MFKRVFNWLFNREQREEYNNVYYIKINNIYVKIVKYHEHIYTSSTSNRIDSTEMQTLDGRELPETCVQYIRSQQDKIVSYLYKHLNGRPTYIFSSKK